MSAKFLMLLPELMAAMGGKSTLDIQQTVFGGIWYLRLRLFDSIESRALVDIGASEIIA